MKNKHLNNIIESMLHNISEHKRDKADLLKLYVQKRLEDSVQAYYSSILDSMNILKNFKEESVLKKLVK